MRHDQDKGGRMGDDIDKAGREFAVAILQDLKEGLKPYVLPLAVTGFLARTSSRKGRTRWSRASAVHQSNAKA